MAELTFTYGTMAAGKSTLALQLCWQLRQSRSDVILCTFADRSATGLVTSRIGIQADAEWIKPGAKMDDFRSFVVNEKIGVVVVDEVHFASPHQIDALATLVDSHGIDVHTFGLGADFRLEVFPGSARLFAIADQARELPLAAQCWCGSKGRCNARIVGDVIAREGDQLVVGDVDRGEVRYQVLCRTHYWLGQLAPADVTVP